MKLPGQTTYEAVHLRAKETGTGPMFYPAFTDLVPERQADWAAGEEAAKGLMAAEICDRLAVISLRVSETESFARRAMGENRKALDYENVRG